MPAPTATAPLIRSAARADAPAIADIRVAGWRATYAGLVPAAYLRAMDPAADAARWLAGWDAGPSRLVAEHAGRVVGFATYGVYRADDDHAGWPRADHDGELQALYVASGSRSAGVGSALLAAALAELAAAGHRTARLWVLAGNARARRFYTRHGFRDESPDGVRQTFTPRGSDVAVPEVRYTRPLSSPLG